MDYRSIMKAIAAASAGALGGAGTAFIVVPASIVLPFYGYVLVGLLNAALSFVVVWLAPANKTAETKTDAATVADTAAPVIVADESTTDA